MQRDLIFDFGLHQGHDTAFYLAKGFRVVAVEANPKLAGLCAQRFGEAIREGRLVVENIGIAREAGRLPFYVNLDNDEWSSFDRALGTREGTRFEIVEVPTLKAEALFARHGVPYFVKIDIEGFDHLVVEAVGALVTKPRFVSVEDNGFGSLLALHRAGGRAFKFLDQVEKWRIRLPDPPREGRYVDTTFLAATSGPFGNEVPGEWMAIDAAALLYLQHIRPPGVGLREHWWDIHARFG